MRLLIALVALTALAACGGGPGEAGADETTSPPTSGSGPSGTRDTTPVSPPGDTVPSTAPPIVGEVPENIMNVLRSDLEGRVGEGIEIVVVRAESVTWPDGSLGCREPGQTYTQALVDGYHVVLRVEGEDFDYRVGSVDNFKLCEVLLRPGG
jgi:hypothetical protein